MRARTSRAGCCPTCVPTSAAATASAPASGRRRVRRRRPRSRESPRLALNAASHRPSPTISSLRTCASTAPVPQLGVIARTEPRSPSLHPRSARSRSAPRPQPTARRAADRARLHPASRHRDQLDRPPQPPTANAQRRRSHPGPVRRRPSTRRRLRARGGAERAADVSATADRSVLGRDLPWGRSSGRPVLSPTPAPADAGCPTRLETDVPALRSRVTTHGRNAAGARALWRATGMADDDFGKPDRRDRQLLHPVRARPRAPQGHG